MEEKEKEMLPDETVAEETAADVACIPTDENPPPKKRKKRVWLIILIVFLSLLLLLALTVQCIWWWLHRSIDDHVQQAPSYTEEELAVTDKEEIVDSVIDANPEADPEDVENSVNSVHNIALFGIDAEKGSVGRSDAIMILSIDKENKKVKLTSLMRDSLVPIEGHGEEKLTHAWAYGHAQLALKTINQAYGMNITDYAYLNFAEFRALIDYIGGVELDVNEIELASINYTTIEKDKLPGTGFQRLDGRQALAYARVRSDSDKNRTGRQREVLIAVYEQVRKQPISKLPETVKQALKSCHTNMSADEIMDIASWAILNLPSIESLSLPNAQLKPWQGILDKARGWVTVYDLDAAKRVLYSFLYEVDTKVTGVTQYVPTTTTTNDTTTATQADTTTTTTTP